MAPITAWKNLNLKARLNQSKIFSKSTPTLRGQTIDSPTILRAETFDPKLHMDMNDPKMQELIKRKNESLRTDDQVTLGSNAEATTSTSAPNYPTAVKRRSARLSASDPGIRASYISDKGTDVLPGQIQGRHLTIEDGTRFSFIAEIAPEVTHTDLQIPEFQTRKSATFGPDASSTSAFEATPPVKSHTLPANSNSRIQNLVSAVGLDRFLKPGISNPVNFKPVDPTTEQLKMADQIGKELRTRKKEEQAAKADKVAKQEAYGQDLSAFLRGEKDAIPVFPQDQQPTTIAHSDKRASLGSFTSRKSAQLTPIITSTSEQEKLAEQRQSSSKKSVSPSSATTPPGLSTANQTPNSAHPVTPDAALQFDKLPPFVNSNNKRQGFVWPSLADNVI